MDHSACEGAAEREGYCAGWSDVGRSPQLVMRGQKRVEDARERAYDPRIHLLRKKSLRRWMDCRVKPGNDRVDGTRAPFSFARSARNATRGCAKWRPGQFPLFRIDSNNENCNSNVSDRRGPCVTPLCHPDVPPCVVIPRVTIRRHNVFGFEAPMSARRIHINPPPGPRPR